MLESLNDHLEELVEERTRELSEANAQLEQIALTDIMTGLPNRRAAFERLANLWQEAVSLACFMVDADHFKAINDGFGHESGDVVVKHIGLCLQQNARRQDLVARLGGDEFLVICPGTDLGEALRLGETLRRAVSELKVYVAEGQGCWSGSVSVGVAARSASTADIEALVALADEGVYLAKREGKNCVRSVQQN
jgi:hemerythrin